jgi:hypothetical protein
MLLTLNAENPSRALAYVRVSSQRQVDEGVSIDSSSMAKLYWKVKRDGKWRWSPVNSETTSGDFEQLEYIVGDCESGPQRDYVSKPKTASKPKRKPKSTRWKNCFSVRFCDDCGEKSRARLTATNSFQCPSCEQDFEEGSTVVFQHYCEECFAEDRPSEIFTPVVDYGFESWCSSCFTIGGKKKRKTQRRR